MPGRFATATKEEREAWKKKAAETRAANKAAKDAKKQEREARKVAGRQGERRPSTTTGQVSAKLRGKCVDLVERVIQGSEAGVLWTARRMTTAVYQLDAEGVPVLGPNGRPVIVARERAISDETLELDKLEDWERRWLASELCDEMLRYPRLKAFLLRMVDLEERSSLPMCVMVLALPRMVRHGLMPAEFSEMVAALRASAAKAHQLRGRPALVTDIEPPPAPPFMDEETPPAAAAG